MTPAGRILVSVALVATLGGCVPASTLDQLRLCRLALVARSDRDAVLTVVSETAIAAAPDESAVRVEAEVRDPSGQARPMTAECRFAGGTANSRGLRSVRIGRDTLSDTALFFLRRFWLAAPESDSADPSPVRMWRGAPFVPIPVAYGLQITLAAIPSFATYGLLAAAYSLVYGLVGRINLAFGAMAAVGGAASLVGLGLLPIAATTTGGMVAVALTAALWAGALHGFGIARWVFLPLRHATGQQGLVAAVGLAFVLGEYLRLAQGATPPYVVPLRTMPYGLAQAPGFVVTLTPLNIVVAAAFALTTGLLLALMRWTQFGRNWRAIADDPMAAALMGVDSVHLFGLTFALASALAGAAGAVTVLLYGSFGGSFGTVLGLKALLAAILGGIGSVPGAFLGALLIALAEALWSAFFPIDNRDLALFLMLSGLLVAQPGGLFGFGDLAPRRV